MEMVDYVYGVDDSDDSVNKGLQTIKDAFEGSGYTEFVFCNGGDRDKTNIPEMIVKNIEFEYTGYLENLDNEINNSDAMISVSDYPVGTRTRILSSLSYGLPCIAHISSALGLHRLKHEEHILFCHDKMSFVECVEKLMNVNGLPEKIGKKSRDLWLKYYNPLINVDKILNIVNC